MTVTADPKRTITVGAKATIDRLSRSRPSYLDTPTAAQGEGPLDNAGGAFPWDVPSEMFDSALREMDKLADSFQHQLDFMREGIAAMRAVACKPQTEAEIAADAHVREMAADRRPKPLTPFREPEPATAARQAEMQAFIMNQPTAEIVARQETLMALGTEQVAAIIAPPPPLPAPVAATWSCPEHGQVADGVSRKGRSYRFCPVCGELDRASVTAS